LLLWYERGAIVDDFVVVVVALGNTRFGMPHLLLEKDNGK